MIYHYSKALFNASFLISPPQSFFYRLKSKMKRWVKWKEGNKRSGTVANGEGIVKHKSLKTAVKSWKLTDLKSQSFNASAASTVLWISPITCLARLIKTASAVSFNPEKLMRNDYLLLETMKFYLIETFRCSDWARTKGKRLRIGWSEENGSRLHNIEYNLFIRRTRSRSR